MLIAGDSNIRYAGAVMESVKNNRAAGIGIFLLDGECSAYKPQKNCQRCQRMLQNVTS